MRTMYYQIIYISFLLCLPSVDIYAKESHKNDSINISVFLNSSDSIPLFNSVRIRVLDWITGVNDYYAPNNNKDTLDFVLKLNSAQEIMIEYKNYKHRIIVFPESKLNITFYPNNPDSIKIEGKDSKYTIELTSYKKFINPYKKTWSLEQFKNKNLRNRDNLKNFIDSVNKLEYKLLDSFCQSKKISTFSKDYLKKTIEFDYLSNILNKKNIKRNIKTIKDQKDSSLIDSNLQIINGLNNVHVVSYSENYYLDELVVYLGNLSESNYRLINAHKNLGNKNFIKFANTLKKYDIDTFLCDILKSRWYYYSINYLKNDIEFDTLIQYIKSPIVLERLYVKRNEELKLSNISDTIDCELINKIISKYKNKAIYIDIWATWCGKCYVEFEELKQVKENFRDIVFVNLCCESDKIKWIKTVKQKKIEGDNIFVNTDEFASLQKLFNIVTYPRYILINKEGKIVTKDAPRPHMKNNLIPLLNSMN